MLEVGRNDQLLNPTRNKSVVKFIDDQQCEDFEMRGRGRRSDPKRLTDKYDLLLTPIVVSLRKLRDVTYPSVTLKGESKEEHLSDLCDISNQFCATEPMNGTCGDDESVCDDRSICQDPGWQKDVSDVLSSILKDGGTCASEWGGDGDQSIPDLPDLEMNGRSKNKRDLTLDLHSDNNLKETHTTKPDVDEDLTNIDACDDDGDSGSDATITEIAENITEDLKELESVSNENIFVPSCAPKSPIESISDVAMSEWPEPENTDKIKTRKVSSLSVYAEVENGVVRSVCCKRFKRRRKKRNDSVDNTPLKPVKLGRRKKSVGYVNDEPVEVIRNEVKDLVKDLVFRVAFNTEDISQSDKWMSEKDVVEELLKEFCEINNISFNEFSDSTSVVDFDKHIVKESDMRSSFIQRKCYKRKFPQEMERMFRKKRRRKLARGEVVKKFLTRSAARRLEYTTASNGDTIVVEIGDGETTSDAPYEIETKNEIAKEVIEEISEPAAKEIADTEVNKSDDVQDEYEVDVETVDEEENPFEKFTAENINNQSSRLTQPTVLSWDNEENNETESKKEASKSNDVISDISNAYGVSKFRHRHQMLQSLKEKSKKSLEPDTPLDLRIKEGSAENQSATKTKTPIQLVHPQVNTSLMPKKLWCARRTLDCFTNGETHSLVNRKNPTETSKVSPSNTPKPELTTTEPKKIQESEAESILRTLLLEASDAEAACEVKQNGQASLSVTPVPSVSDKDSTKTSEHRDTLNRVKEVLNRATPKPKSSPTLSNDSSTKHKTNEHTENSSDVDKFQDPLQIKEEIKKLKNEIVHLEMIAEQKEKERVAIICFKKCKEEILKQIESNQTNILLHKDGYDDKDPIKSHHSVHSKISLHDLYTFAKNKMLDAHRQSSLYQSSHRETCMVRPIVAHENRKSPMGNESLPSVEALVAKATENYGVSFDHLSEEKADSLTRRTIEHNRRLAELQQAYQCCTDPLWRNSALYGFASPSAYCSNSFHTPLTLPTKLPIEQTSQDAHLKACWKYGAINDYSNKERHRDIKLKDDHTKTESSRDSKLLFHPTAAVPPVTWSEKTYCKPNGTIISKASDIPSSSRLTSIASVPTTTYIGSTLGRYGSMNLSQSFYPNYGLSMSCWNSYPSPQISHRHQTTEFDASAKVRNENQRWMDRPCPTYHTPYTPTRGNSTSPC